MATEQDCAAWSQQNGWPVPLCRGYARAGGQLDGRIGPFDAWGNATGRRLGNPTDPRIAGRFGGDWVWFVEDTVPLSGVPVTPPPAGTPGPPAVTGSARGYTAAFLGQLFDWMVARDAEYRRQHGQHVGRDAWRQLAIAGGMRPADAADLTEAIFAYVDRWGYTLPREQFVTLALNALAVGAPAPTPPVSSLPPGTAPIGPLPFGLPTPVLIGGAALLAYLFLRRR
jgi:hypothetical protein